MTSIPVLSELVSLIEEIFKAHGPEVVKAAEQAAITASVQTAEQDPKVEAVTAASIALLTAAKSLKEAIDTQEPSAPSTQPQDAPNVVPPQVS